MKVLVWGWYNNHFNIGDELFKSAFQTIFPSFDFKFVDKISSADLDNFDIIFFGGGSFLDGKPTFTEETMYKIANKQIFYIGVGADTNIHPWHKFLLRKAKLIACRSENFENLKILNNNVRYFPDIVYSLSNNVVNNTNSNSILILPNASVSSRWNDEAWKHNAWEYFKSEFSQFLEVISDKYKIDFFPMCKNYTINDYFSSIELINKTQNHSKYSILEQEYDFKKISKIFSSYKLIISQRYHGLILSDIFKIPCINIHHHNKLKNFSSNRTENISYYNISKDLLLQKLDKILYINSEQLSNNISIKSDIFENLRNLVLHLIKKE